DFSLAALEIPSKSVSVRFTVSLGNDEVGHYSTDRLVAGPPKDAHSAIIPISYDAVRLHDNCRIKSGFQDRAQLVPPCHIKSGFQDRAQFVLPWIQAVRSRIDNG